MPENSLTPAERSLIGRVASNRRWALLPKAERAKATQAARDGRWRRYLERVDPEGKLPEEERNALARQLRRADMQAAALKSARARARKV